MKFGISNYRFVIVLCTRTNQWKSLNIDLQRYTRKYDIIYHPETSGTGQRMTLSGEKRKNGFCNPREKQCFVGIGWTIATVCTGSSTINVTNIFTQLISLFEIVQAHIKCFPRWKLV